MAKGIALVTGAGSGIGRAAAAALLADGFRVVLAGRREAPLVETAALSGVPDRAIVHPVDVSRPEEVTRLYGRIGDEAGRLDVLFNNAGIFPKSVPLEDISFEDWSNVVAINLTGAFLVAQGAFRMMKTQTPRGGRIINNGSLAAQVPRRNSAPYAATKHAITGLTKSLSLDGRDFDIACGQIDIGNAATDLLTQIGSGASRSGPGPEPTLGLEHVADAVLYMANLPLSANVQFMTVMATRMPFIGRG